jgi:octaprenyl-diphosphate synthase
MQSQLTNCAARAYGLIEADMHKVRKLIDEQVASQSSAAEGVLSYVRAHRGKMLRPALVLLSGRCCGQTSSLHLQIAAIVELIHTATLLHDDVIDESQQRRGRQTVNSLYGNETAVLSGDFLFSKVFRMCAEMRDSAVSKILADTCIRVCQGELEQNFHRRNWQLSETDYIRIITEKSASFLSSCCHLGALAANAQPSQISALADFGLNIGIAFQITDDVLDIVGSEQTMGKRAGSDFDRNKLTLPLIHLLSNADADARAALIEILESPEQTHGAKARLLEHNGSLDYARACAAQFHKAAVETLAVLRRSDAKAALIETADFCINRPG